MGGILTIIGPAGIFGTEEEFSRLFPICLPVLVLGPSVAGILLTALVALDATVDVALRHAVLA